MGLLDSIKSLFFRDQPKATSTSGGDPNRWNQATSYRGAEINRLNQSWLPPHRSGDATLFDSWYLLTARIRDMVRNDPAVGNIKRSLVKYVIGGGIQSFAAAMDDEGEPLDDWNYEADEIFKRWADDEADVEGKLSWWELQAMAFGEMVEAGESFLLECSNPDPSRTVPLCYQLLESEQLDWSMDRMGTAKENRIVRGVEMDAKNRPVAYWVFDSNPFGLYTTSGGYSSTPIPASRIIHNFIRPRPSHTRGVSWFAPIIQPAKDLDWLLGNVLTTAALHALLTFIVKEETPGTVGMGLTSDPNQGSSDASGNSLFKIGRGTLARIGAKDSVEALESKTPSPNYGDFVKLMQQQESMGMGISYLRMSGDYTATSFISARAAHLDDQAYFNLIQGHIGRQTITPVRRAHSAQAAAFGLYGSKLNARQFLKERRRYDRLDIQAPGREQLDPEAETEAARGRIDCGLSNLQKECALRGDNWLRVMKQRARENKMAEKLQVELNFGKGASQPAKENDPATSGKDQPSANKTPAANGKPAANRVNGTAH